MVKREFGKLSKSQILKLSNNQNVMTVIVLQIFLLLFMSLLTALIVKNSHVLAGTYIIFLRKCPRPNLKVFQ